jgi:hypothetical protein
MKKIFILLTSMFLLVGCIESLVTVGGGAMNGKFSQSSLNTIASYGVKKTTGKTPLGHSLSYVKKKKNHKKENSCSSFVDKKALEVCLILEKRIISKQAEIKKKEFSNKLSRELNSSLQSSINEKSKIKYLD